MLIFPLAMWNPTIQHLFTSPPFMPSLSHRNPQRVRRSYLCTTILILSHIRYLDINVTALMTVISVRYARLCGPGSSVSIATGYGLDGPGIESRWGEIFRTCPDRSWDPHSLLYNGYRVFPGGKERPGRHADLSPPSSAVGHERVELYLYSHYGPYGLYRASVPVQGCTLPLLFYARL